LNTVIWARKMQPYRRTGYPPSTISAILLNALDLCHNHRGIGWTWSKGIKLPEEYRAINNRLVYLVQTVPLLVLSVLRIDALEIVLRTLYADTLARPNGGYSIFDHNLPIFRRYVASTFVTFLCAWRIKETFELAAYVVSLVMVGVLGYPPSSCPPGMGSPLLSTSVQDFWGRQWHQYLRFPLVEASTFIQPAIPGSKRTKLVLGTFITSGFVHVLAYYPLAHHFAIFEHMLFFIGNGMALLVEDAMRRNPSANRPWLLWIWMWCVLLVLGNVWINALCKMGYVGAHILPDSLHPVSSFLKTYC
ncbi:hypothetical protein FISHEDRAFT_53281, partial [Fistulina hepatica ATCC 64428]